MLKSLIIYQTAQASMMITKINMRMTVKMNWGDTYQACLEHCQHKILYLKFHLLAEWLLKLKETNRVANIKVHTVRSQIENPQKTRTIYSFCSDLLTILARMTKIFCKISFLHKSYRLAWLQSQIQPTISEFLYLKGIIIQKH